MSLLSKSVKYKYFSAVILTVLACVMLSSCKKVSEEPLNSDIQTANSVILTEETTQTAETTNESKTEPTQKTEDTTSENNVQSESALQSESVSSSEKVTETTVSVDYPEDSMMDDESPEDSLSPVTQTEPAEQTTSAKTTNVVTTTVVTTTAETEESSVTEITIQTESPAETAVQSYNTSGYSALNYNEQKGIWISYLEYSSAMMNKSAKEFRKTIGKYFDNVKALSFNTVYVQVRAFGDAYYYSDLFPTGEIGRAHV